MNRTKKKKKSTLYLVRTKASELVDFPGVNTPLETSLAQSFDFVNIFLKKYKHV